MTCNQMVEAGRKPFTFMAQCGGRIVTDGRDLYPSENEEDPEKWGFCWNSDRTDHKCPHRHTMSKHLCISRLCPEE